MQRTHTRMKSNGKNNIREFRISNNSINMIRRETIVDLLLKTQAVSSKITKFPKIFQTEGKTSTKTINSIKLKRSSIAIDKVLNDKKLFQDIVDKLFTIIDKDKSGGLDIHEIEEFMVTSSSKMGMATPPSKENIKAMFDKLDVNKDKILSKEELSAFVKEMLENQKKACLS